MKEKGLLRRALRWFRRDARPAGTAGGTGQSGPGERGYDGQVTIGDEGAQSPTSRERDR